MLQYCKVTFSYTEEFRFTFNIQGHIYLFQSIDLLSGIFSEQIESGFLFRLKFVCSY